MSEQRGPSAFTFAFFTLLISGLTGYGTWQFQQQEVQNARIQATTAKEQAATAKEQLELNKKTLNLREKEIAGLREDKMGVATARREAAKYRFDDADGVTAKRRVLRQFADEISTLAHRSDRLSPYGTRTLPGLPFDLVFMRESLQEVPTTLDLSNIDAHGMWMRDYDMPRVDFTHADLRAANLSLGRWANATFVKTDLSCADLNGADLSGASLTGTILAWADLRGADLRSVRNADKVVLTGITWDRSTKWPEEKIPPDKRPPSARYSTSEECAAVHFPPRANGQEPSTTAPSTSSPDS